MLHSCATRRSTSVQLFVFGQGPSKIFHGVSYDKVMWSDDIFHHTLVLTIHFFVKRQVAFTDELSIDCNLRWNCLLCDFVKFIIFQMQLKPDLRTDQKTGDIRAVTGSAFEAITNYRVLSSNHGAALVECKPETGLYMQSVFFPWTFHQFTLLRPGWSVEYIAMVDCGPKLGCCGFCNARVLVVYCLLRL